MPEKEQEAEMKKNPVIESLVALGVAAGTIGAITTGGVLLAGGGIITAGLAALTAASAYTYLGGGRVTAKIERAIFYNEDLKKIANRYWYKTRPRPMQTRRLANTPEDHLVFSIKDFSYFDAEQAKKELQALEEDENVDIVALNKARDAAKKAREETIKRGETPKDELSETTESDAIKYYDIKLKIKNPNIRIGEIDFSDWNRDDFEVVVISQINGEVLAPKSEEYNKVLNNLQRYTKLSHASSLLRGHTLTPEMSAAEHVPVSLDETWVSKIGFGAFNLANAIDWGRSAFNPAVVVVNDTDAGENPHLKSENYVRGLVHLAVDKAEEGDLDILDNYYQTLDQSIENEYLLAHKLKVNRENEVKAREKAAEGLTIRKTLKLAFKLVKVLGFVATTALVIGFVFALIPPLKPLADFFIGKALVAMKSTSEFQLGAISTTILAIGISGTTLFGIAKFFGKLYSSLEDKPISEYIDEHLEAAKQELEEFEALEQDAAQRLYDLRTLKAGAKTTLEKTLNLESEELDLKDENIGDLGISIICNYMTIVDVNFSFCRRLVLSNCRITDIGATELARALESSQRTLGQAKIYEIDLTGNPTGEIGIKAIGKALANNFTVRTLKFDKEAVDSTTIELIEKQLIINSYLQGVESGIKQRQINKLFPGGEVEIRNAAEKKLKDNPRIIDLPLSTNPKMAALMGRIKKIHQLRILVEEFPKAVEIRQAKEKFKALVDIYREPAENLESLNIDTNKLLFLVGAGIRQEELFPLLEELDKKHLTVLLQTCFSGHTDSEKKAALVANIIDTGKPFTSANIGKAGGLWELLDRAFTINFSYDNLKAALTEQLNKAKRDGKSIFETNKREDVLQVHIQDELESKTEYACLRKANNKTGLEELKRELDTNLELRKFDFHSNIDAEVKTYIENIIKRNEIRSVLENKNLVEDRAFDLAAILMSYENMDPEFLSPPAIDPDKLLSIVKIDLERKKPLEFLKDLSKKHPRHFHALLKTCFSSHNNPEEKATLVAQIITSQDGFSSSNLRTADTLERLLDQAFTNTSYADLKAELIKQLKNNKSANNTAEVKLRENILQATEQKELTKNFACLQEPGYNTADFKSKGGLKESLDENFDLRDFELPDEGMNDDVRAYIRRITLRNQLHDALRDYRTPEQRLLNFAKTLESIPGEEQEQALNDFMEKDGETLLNLVKKDTYPNNCQALKNENIKKSTRIEIIKQCLIKQEQGMLGGISLIDRDNLQGVAGIVSKLIDTNPRTYQKQIWQMFNWPREGLLSGGPYTRWQFEDYITELKSLKDPAMDKIIQAGYQEILTNKLMRNTDQHHIYLLTNELEENFDLMVDDDDPVLDRIHPQDRQTIEFYSQRNKLIKLFVDHPDNIEESVATFKETYKKMRGKASEIFKHDERIAIFARIMAGSPKILAKENIKTIIENAFSHLNEQQPEEFRSRLEKKIHDIETNKDININDTIAMLDILDHALHPEFNSAELKVHQLKRLAKSPNSDVEHFFSVCKEIPAEELDEALKDMDPLNVLKIIDKDLGSSDQNVNCRRLRDLAENNMDGCIKLLTHCFSINEPSPEDAYKKAILVTNILSTPELFDHDDPHSKEIRKYLVYWTITCRGYGLRGVDKPYYPLNYLLAEGGQKYAVGTILKNMGTPATKGLIAVKEGLEEAIKATENPTEQRTKTKMPPTLRHKSQAEHALEQKAQRD